MNDKSKSMLKRQSVLRAAAGRNGIEMETNTQQPDAGQREPDKFAHIKGGDWQFGRNRDRSVKCKGCKRKFAPNDRVLVIETEVNCMRGDDVVEFYCVACAGLRGRTPPGAKRSPLNPTPPQTAALRPKPTAASLAKDDRFVKTAAEHRDADHRCGRKWQCACVACLAVRSRILKGDLIIDAKSAASRRDELLAAARNAHAILSKLAAQIICPKNTPIHVAARELGEAIAAHCEQKHAETLPTDALLDAVTSGAADGDCDLVPAELEER